MGEDERSEEVRFASDGLSLAGTFVDPGDARAAVLILSGSGQLDRDANAPKLRLEINPAIAEAIADLGVASLRYDKRGADASDGDFYATGMTDNYADACAALKLLATRVPGRSIYAIGHSEGALHAAHLAADGAVSGAVLICCPARRGEEILTWQAAQIVPTLPLVTKGILRLIRLDPLQSQQKAFARIRGTSADSIRVQGKKLNARWFREFMDYDPVPMYGRIDVAVLVVVAGHDMQVPPGDGKTICKLIGGSCDEVVVPNLSHLLRDDPESKGPRGYRKSMKAPISPAVLTAIAGWFEEQLALPPHVGAREDGQQARV